MAPNDGLKRYSWLYLFVALLLAAFPALVSAKPPSSNFQNLPSRIFYFEDSSVVVYHDAVEQDVYISEDEGQNWSQVSDVPKGEAVMFIEHPFDNRIAYIMTTGTKHWRTANRGKLWQSFDVPVKKAMTPSPLTFHSDKTKAGYVLYQGVKCDGLFPWAKDCEDETYYTTDGFATNSLLLKQSTTCQFAHSTGQMPATTHSDLILCVAFDGQSVAGMHAVSDSRLYASSDFFKNEKTIVDFGKSNPKASRGVMALGIVSKFLVAAVRDLVSNPMGTIGQSEMILYVSLDGYTWSHARFPHGSSSRLLENSYTIVESTTHSVAVDVLTHAKATVGTLFMSNSNGTYFMESLQNTNRNGYGFVDFEDVYGAEGVGLANFVDNAQEVDKGDWGHERKKIKSVITFDDGRSWSPITPPSVDTSGKSISCDSNSGCSLHLYSVTSPHNVGRIFSTPAPGVLMGVGSASKWLKSYDECDTFLSLDAGVTWTMVQTGARKYEVGDSGGVIVTVDDEQPVDYVEYSYDYGKTWKKYDLGTTVRARALTTIPDSTSRKFILLGTYIRSEGGHQTTIFLDFGNQETGGSSMPKCQESDMEKIWARTQSGKECLMGHKQWYWRRKQDASCYIGDEFKDPVEHEEKCQCEDSDFECDYNYVRQNGKCVAVGPEPIPAGVCPGNMAVETYIGSSGYRLIPGNTCIKNDNNALDKPITKDCSKAQPPAGNATHQTFEFPEQVVNHWFFRESSTIIVQLRDAEVWQSGNEGYSWAQPIPNERILAVYFHQYSNDRAYMFAKDKVYITTDTGRSWNSVSLPSQPNMLGVPILHTHPLESDWLIYIGAEDCEGTKSDCHTAAYYSTTHGRSWTKFETYVMRCSWARDKDLKIDSRQILCETYSKKKGNQFTFLNRVPLELWLGGNFFKNKQKLFNNVVGHAKFSEYLLVGEVGKDSLELQVSLDGKNYHKGMFPPDISPSTHAYTVLESSTDSVFLHLTTSSLPEAEWGDLLKSNSNGTYYGISLEYVNRNAEGYVDFEKMIGLDGIAVMNVVANPTDAAVSKKKKLQTRITHNDGGSWKPMTPPAVDSLGQKYDCQGVQCALHIHGYTERIDARATYSSPSAVGLMMAVGNVGEYLAPYTDSNTFFTRDGGFTWEEIRKDAHMFEFGDSGSILVLINDEGPTDHVLFSTNEGLSWREYNFGERIRAASIVTMTAETSRKFILFGHVGAQSVAIHLDFSAITSRKCSLSIEDPNNDDFELWSPSEEREERCLFGRQTLYHRRIRDHDCVVGDQVKNSKVEKNNCQCIATDFECEFNHVRSSVGECVLVDGAVPLSVDNSETCIADPDSSEWWERTEYRKIPYSTCEGGVRLDRGPAHRCPGLRGHSKLFWLTILILPLGFTALVGYYYYKKGYKRGAIRLPDTSGRADFSNDSTAFDTLASVPWFLLGVAATTWAAIASMPLWERFRRQRGYRNVAVDEDAQVLRFNDEE